MGTAPLWWEGQGQRTPQGPLRGFLLARSIVSVCGVVLPAPCLLDTLLSSASGWTNWAPGESSRCDQSGHSGS